MKRASYKDWEREFPGYVILRKEGYFYTAYNSSAIALNYILDYKIFIDKFGRETAGGPSLEKIESSLDCYGIKYIVIDGDSIVSRFDCGRSFDQVSVSKTTKRKTDNTRRDGIRAGCRVNLINCTTKEELNLIVCDITVTTIYNKAGGSYYGAGVELIRNSDGGKVKDNRLQVSTDSPIGKALLGHVIGERVSVKLPSGNIDEYSIIDVK